ncbi:MAG: hypothetical protein HFI61_12085, partial [Lachnospiraceae bacterium]|nr:hypothetical protein [Lachnospiraceae bacterium]
FSAALTCVSNVGPGLEAIGPSGNFAAFSGLSKGQNEKSHSSKISLRKVALNKRNLYFSFLLLGTAFLP